MNIQQLEYIAAVDNLRHFAKAAEAFNKGIAQDKKALYSRLGLASIKLGKGDKTNAIAEIKEIVKDSREKDTDLLAEAGKTLIKYEKNNG